MRLGTSLLGWLARSPTFSLRTSEKLRCCIPGRATMDVPETVLSGKCVLVIWHQANVPEAMKPVLEALRARVGGAGKVTLEHAERLVLGMCSLSLWIL